jgi:hypothetical protein
VPGGEAARSRPLASTRSAASRSARPKLTWGSGEPYSRTATMVTGTRKAAASTMYSAMAVRVIARMPPSTVVEMTRAATMTNAPPDDTSSRSAVIIDAVAIAAAIAAMRAATTTMVAARRTARPP